MPDTRNYLVKNTKRKPVTDRHPNAGAVHPYITRDGVPAAFSLEAAKEMSLAMNGNDTDIIVVPDDMVVSLDPSARKLPQSSDVGVQRITTGIIEH